MRLNNMRARPAGFTLVELLLAITLMSILLALTYSGLRAATRSTERGEVMLAVGGEMRAAHQFVRRQLNQVVPLTFSVTDDIDPQRIVFIGDGKSIQYVAPMPGYLGSGGPQVQLLELANGTDGSVLQFRHALLQTYEEGRLYDRDPVILLENIESAEFEFIGRDEQGELMAWTSSWDQQEVLPVAVRLNVAFSEDVHIQWPELVAGVRVDGSAFSGAERPPSYQEALKGMITKGGSTR